MASLVTLKNIVFEIGNASSVGRLGIFLSFVGIDPQTMLCQGVNEISCSEVLDMDSFVVIREDWDNANSRHVNMISKEKVDERKLLDSKISLGEKS